jgi:plasmid stabilization system protein ParE
MSYTLVVQPSARDIADSYAFYSEQGRGDLFMVEVDHVFAQISERPRMYPVVYAEVHRALLRRFAYSVFFIVEADRANVLAVHHQRRDPDARP